MDDTGVVRGGERVGDLQAAPWADTEWPNEVPKISSKGCECRRDHLHFTPAGYRELGKRYAETMLELM